MSKIVRILIADDHSVVRAGLRALLERQGHFRVVAEAGTGEEAVAKAQEHHPDVAVLDIRMPGLSGIEACRRIVETVEGCRVIMLTSYAEDELLFAAVQAGASGYILKRIGDNELVQAVERVSRGEGMLDPAMTSAVFAEMRKANQAQQAAAFSDLTAQEMAVLALVAEGLTNRQIAVKLYLGEGTVRNYVSSILAKIGVSNRAEAAAYAVKHNINELVPPSSLEKTTSTLQRDRYTRRKWALARHGRLLCLRRDISFAERRHTQTAYVAQAASLAHGDRKGRITDRPSLSGITTPRRGQESAPHRRRIRYPYGDDHLIVVCCHRTAQIGIGCVFLTASTISSLPAPSPG